jgi:hypothetical protein
MLKWVGETARGSLVLPPLGPSVELKTLEAPISLGSRQLRRRRSGRL